VAEIDTAVQNLKKKESERMNYMTYAMKILEEREEGRREGRNEGRNEGERLGFVKSIQNLMKTSNLTADAAMDALLIPQEIRSKISLML